MNECEPQQVCSNACSKSHNPALSFNLLNLGRAVHRHTALKTHASSCRRNVVEEGIGRSPCHIVTRLHYQRSPGVKWRSTLCVVCPGRLLGRQEPRRFQSYLLEMWQAQRSTLHKHARVLCSENVGLHLMDVFFQHDELWSAQRGFGPHRLARRVVTQKLGGASTAPLA